MRIVINILILYLILLQSFSEVLGQGVPKACGGAIERYKTVGLYQSNFVWSIEGGTYVQLPNRSDTITKMTDTSIVVVTWDMTPGYHTISVAENNTHSNPFSSCDGPLITDSVLVEVPVFEIAEKDQEICSGPDATFTYHATPGYSYYIWDAVNTINNYLTTPTGGLHRVNTTIVIDDTHPGDTTICKLSDSTYLTINITPFVGFVSDTILCADERLLLVAGITDSLYTYDWSTGDITESIEIGAGANEYWVRVTSQKNCVTYDTIVVDPCQRSYLLGNIPNTITPFPADGFNDTWTVPLLKNFPEAKVEIYDRWGRIVWNSDKAINKSLTVDWDGRDLSGKELPMDGYYYIIYLNREGTTPVVGHINLVR